MIPSSKSMKYSQTIPINIFEMLITSQLYMNLRNKHNISKNSDYQQNLHKNQKLGVVYEDDFRKSTHFRKDSAGVKSYYQSQHQNQYEVDNTFTKDFENGSECPSIQNTMFQNLLLELEKEIKLKTKGFKTACSVIQKLQVTIKSLEDENKTLLKQLEQSFSRITKLEQQLLFYKNDKFPTPKSITKTYLSDININFDSTSPSPCSLISSEIFNEFVVNYDSLVQQLENWLHFQRQQQLNKSIFMKLELHSAQIEEVLSSRNYQQQCSKSTYETSNEKAENFKSGDSCSEYERIIEIYRAQIIELTKQLHQCIRHIQKQERDMMEVGKIFKQRSNPKSLIPKQLIKIIMRELIGIVKQKYDKLKEQNLELVKIVQQMISWVQSNSKDGGQRFQSAFSNIF